MMLVMLVTVGNTCMTVLVIDYFLLLLDFWLRK
jgi:hypothetical protein